MKIYNIAELEKLKIRPVDIKTMDGLHPVFRYRELKLNCIDKIESLAYGSIIRTRFNSKFDINIYIYVELSFVKKLVPTYSYNCDALIHPTSVRSDNISFLSVDGYEDTWPKYQGHPVFDVMNVYKSNFNLFEFDTPEDFCRFFIREHLLELR